jgi:diguanylate cyclase (GGDEF)-like protein
VLSSGVQAGERVAELIDQASLFIAAGVCAGALALTMLNVWLHNRSDNFLIGWTLGMLLLGSGVMLYYTLPPDRMAVVAAAFTMEIVGFVIVFIAACQFTRRATTWRQLLVLCTAAPMVGVPILLGYDGFGIMIYNFIAGSLLMATAMQYWNARAEAPSSIAALALLYGLAAVSFYACASIIAHEQTWAMAAYPDNWAEKFNALMCIAGITGIGALSLGLNHARAARKHREEAETDVLTGLRNRRALFDRMANGAFDCGHAVILFDLDRFKSINDGYGHAVGDEVLRRFADALRLNVREGEIAARTGGEEFVLVLREASLPLATSTAERIRALFAESQIETAKGPVRAPARAGGALPGRGEGFEEVLNRADASLYRAKNGGRNRVSAELKLHTVQAAG